MKNTVFIVQVIGYFFMAKSATKNKTGYIFIFWCFEEVFAFYKDDKLVDNASIQSVLVRIDSN